MKSPKRQYKVLNYENFVVFTEDKAWLQIVAQKDAEIRKEMGWEPESRRRTVVFFGEKKHGNIIFISPTSNHIHVPYQIAALKHELTHAILRDTYGDELPPYIHEGYAARYDTFDEKLIRQHAFNQLLKDKAVPPVSKIIEWESIGSYSVGNYAIACRLVSWLESRYGRERTIRFGLTKDANVLGTTIQQLDRDWYDSLRQ